MSCAIKKLQGERGREFTRTVESDGGSVCMHFEWIMLVRDDLLVVSAA